MYRSLLYVPAHSERFLSKAHERGADAIIIDLEDAVPEADKDAARANLAHTVGRATVPRNAESRSTERDSKAPLPGFEPGFPD